MNNYGCCSNPNEALGMPAGSVRGILALVIIPPSLLTMCALMILFFIWHEYEKALSICAVLSGIAGTVVGYYFGTRTAEKANDVIARNQQILIETKDNIISQQERQIERMA